MSCGYNVFVSGGERKDAATMRQISAERAGPLKGLNDHANGFLAEGEGRRAKSPERERERERERCWWEPNPTQNLHH